MTLIKIQILLQGFDNEEFLSSSYMSLFESQLRPYFQYVLWGDPRNSETTRMLYAKRLSFPFNFVYPQRYIKLASEFLKIVSNFSIDDKLENHNTAEMVLNAKKWVNLLAQRIEKKRWFFGDQKPGECDATIYATLSILLNLQLPNNDLKSHINECPHLVAYIERINKRYMTDIRISSDNEPSHSTLNRVQRLFINKEKGTLSNGVIKVMFGMLTVSTMVFFAFSHGILEIANDDDDLAQYYGDDEGEHFSEE